MSLCSRCQGHVFCAFLLWMCLHHQSHLGLIGDDWTVQLFLSLERWSCYKHDDLEINTFKIRGFPGGSEVKNLPADAGGTRDTSLILESGRSSGVGNGNLLQYSCLEKFHGQRSLVGYKLRHDRVTEHTHIHTFKTKCAWVFCHVQLCYPIICSLPGSTVYEILQARILEWIAFLLQGIFPTQGSNSHLWCLLHQKADSLPLSHLGYLR